MARTYAIRTYGCQMNEHDSERLAGLLESDGLEAAASPDDADVVVLNTCCIRENADNKLYGALGHLKAAKRERPDLEIVVAGCLAQKDRELVRERAPHVDVVLGTHNVHRAGELLARARRDGPVTEIWDEAPDDVEAFPSALPTKREVDHAAWVTIQIGCDNTCAFCIVPAVRGPEVSRPFGDVVAEVERLASDGVIEITLLGQNVNSYGRDLDARAGAQTAPDRRRRRTTRANGRRPTASTSTAAAVRRPAARRSPRSTGIRRVPLHEPAPKDLRPETIAAMAEVPEVCPHLHLPLQSGSDRTLAGHAPGLHRRALPRAARRGPRRRSPDLAVTTDLIVGFPGETDDDFERSLEVVAEAGYDCGLHLPLLIAARHRGRRAHRRRSCPPTWRPSASTASGPSSSGRPSSDTGRASGAPRRS
ncbi:MAG: radical SAM protein [Acidimicrobiia bacterium]|nr:radical SAM protein [Acidimicrobiia bacterium]